MKTSRTNLLMLLAAAAIIAAGGYALWHNQPSGTNANRARTVVGYQDSMHPWIKSDRPGKCTICGMDLTPIREGDQGFATQPGTVVLKSNNITVLNVQTEEVKRRPLSRTFRLAGTLEPNETRKTFISAPARGRIDALAVDYAGVEVEKGQRLFTMFSPELVQLRKTLLAVKDRAPQTGSTNAAHAGSDPGLYSGDIYSGDILAPQSGVVLERNVYQGQYVAEGDRLLTIVDASILWFRFDVYEQQLPWFELGQKLEVTVQAVPGKVFPAVISFIDPVLNDTTRAVKVRADILNPVVPAKIHPHRTLRFGMYAEGVMRAAIDEVLSVPRSAVLMPGNGAFAYVDEGGGAYARRRVKLGRRGDEFWEVLGGLEEGERVISAGNVLVDAQAQFNLASESEKEEDHESAMDEPGAVQELPKEIMAPVTIATMDATGEAAGKPVPKVATPVVRHMSASRTERMSAIMSPGGELQMIRRAAILAELAQKATNSPPSTPEQRPEAGMLPAHTMEGPANLTPPETPGQSAAPSQGQAPVTEMRGVRRAPIAQPDAPKASDTSTLTAAQRQALTALVGTSDGLSQALAADDLAKFNRFLTNEPNAIQALPKAFGPDHRYSDLIQRLVAAGKTHPAADLAEARKQFLPYSTAIVELTKQLRKEDPAFASLKVYHCPMAPKPGLWMQAKAPLRNPFYGAKMLTCGEEVVR